MATIGTFTKSDNAYNGQIQTLGLKAKVAITPVEKNGETARPVPSARTGSQAPLGLPT